MEDAKWYFTHETEEDRLWYRIFFCDVPEIRRVVVESQREAEGFH